MDNSNNISNEPVVKDNKNTIIVILSILVVILSVLLLLSVFNNSDNKDTTNNIIPGEQKNKEEVVEEEKEYEVVTFDNFLSKWGNDIINNKFFEIKDVKLGNKIDSLYIDYYYDDSAIPTTSYIVFKHGNKEIYRYGGKESSFNIRHLSLYNDLLLFGASRCQYLREGQCINYFTYSLFVAFNEENKIYFYDNTVVERYGEVLENENKTVFKEDESIYPEPYNDFRINSVEIKDNYIYFYTIAEDYKELYAVSLLNHGSCENTDDTTLRYDIQRTYRTTIINNSSIGNLEKVSSISYSDYCKNKDLLEIQK